MRSAIEILWVAAVMAFVLGVASQCDAQCEGVVDRVSDMVRDGVEGVFVPTEPFACLTLELEARATLADRVHVLERRLELRDATVTRLQRATQLGTQTIADLQDAHAKAVRRAIEAEDRSWWQSPALWFVLGAVVMTVGATVIFSLTGKL